MDSESGGHFGAESTDAVLKEAFCRALEKRKGMAKELEIIKKELQDAITELIAANKEIARPKKPSWEEKSVLRLKAAKEAVTRQEEKIVEAAIDLGRAEAELENLRQEAGKTRLHCLNALPDYTP